MNLTIRIYCNPAVLTFEKAGALGEALARFRSSVEFDENFCGKATVHTRTPLHHEVLRELDGAGVTMTDIRGPQASRSFKEYFGTRLPLDAERAQVYVTMCEEGRI